MKEQNETFPSALEAFFLIVALYAVEYVVGAALRDLRTLSGIDPRDVWGVVTLFGNGILFSALLYYKRLSYKSLFHSSKNSVGATLAIVSVPILLLMPALTLAMWTVVSALVSVFEMSRWQQAMFEEMTSNGFASIVTVCILAPVLEEMLFRGIILRSFLQQYSRTRAIVASAALFGLAHLNIYQFVVGFMLGLVAGWLYERTRSVWPCVLFHAAYNSVIIWLSLSLRSVWEVSMWYWGGAFLLASVGTLLLQRLLAAGAAAK